MSERHLSKHSGNQQHPSPQGTNYLLTLAIDEYIHCPVLHNAVKDAQDFVKVLTQRYCFDPDNTTTLYNKEVTLPNIYAEMKKLRNTVSADDNLIVYFSGHGYYDKESNNGYLVPVTANDNAVWEYLPNSEMLSLIKSIDSFHTLLIVDSCFSGSLILKKNVIGAEALAMNVEKLPSRWGLAAGSIEEVEDGIRGENSPFAQALLTYLRVNEQSKLPVSELAQYVRKVTPHNAKQTPIYGALFKVGDKGGEFVFNLKEVSEKSIWEEAVLRNTEEGFKIYLKRFPDGQFVVQAQHYINTLRDENAWTKALSINKIYAYDDYLEAFPTGRYAKEAVAKIRTLEEKNTWEVASDRHTISAYRTYLIRYPKGEFSTIAKLRIEQIRNNSKPSVDISDLDEQAVEYDLVSIEQGEFLKGELFNKVVIDTFKIGKYPVTFEQYDQFCQSANHPFPSDEGWGRAKRPVINVSWYDAIEFCNWLSRQEKLEEVYTITDERIEINWSANGYRLPTEAEWEYAARGGQKSKEYTFSGGNQISQLAWTQDTDIEASIESRVISTQEVGQKTPNELGLYDMNGNVWEWCTDGIRKYTSQFVDNPKGHSVSQTEPAAVRGGAWDSKENACFLEIRGRNIPSYKANNYGFRCVRKH